MTSAILAPKSAPVRTLCTVSLQDELRREVAIARQWALFLAAIGTGNYAGAALIGERYGAIHREEIAA